MIYFNQAATSWPKPESVREAVLSSLEQLPVSQNRSAVANEIGDVFLNCRKKIAALFNIKEYKRIYFTSSATDAFNKIIPGLCLENKKILVTANEHNAVLRPLYNNYSSENIAVAGCDKWGFLDIDSFKSSLNKDVKAVFVNHCSNVTGAVQDIKLISEMVHEAGALLILDVSQSAGIVDIDVDGNDIDVLVFTGHKGLYGPTGTGGFYISPAVKLKPVVFGGTGYDSRNVYADFNNPEYEVGTQNLHGISGLMAGVEFVEKTGVINIAGQEKKLIDFIRHGLKDIDKIHIYGNEKCEGPVFSFNVEGLKPHDVSYILKNSYDIITRSGIHCAPFIHETIGSGEDGCVRASVSYFNTEDEAETFVSAVKEIAGLI